jgi:hypothetical protein
MSGSPPALPPPGAPLAILGGVAMREALRVGGSEQ